MADILIY